MDICNLLGHDLNRHFIEKKEHVIRQTFCLRCDYTAEKRFNYDDYYSMIESISTKNRKYWYKFNVDN